MGFRQAELFFRGFESPFFSVKKCIKGYFLQKLVKMKLIYADQFGK